MKKWPWWGSKQLHLLVVVVEEGMARPSEMKNKRKEVVDLGDEEAEGEAEAEAEAEVRITGVSETAKRQKLNHSNDGELTKGYRDGAREGARDGEASGSGTLEMVGRILEARRRKSTRPLPARIGTQTVDLIALYSRVQSLGGYSKVTEAKLWPSISGALGLGLDCGPAVKLVFVKYLKALEADKHASARVELGKHLHPAHAHSVRENQNQNQNGDAAQRKKENDGALVSDEEVIGDLRGREQERNQLECRQSSTREDWATTYASGEHRDGSPSRNLTRVDEEEGSGVSEDWYEGAREENVQQQREALRGMVEWIRQAALRPVDTAVAFGEGSSADEGWASQCHMLTAKVRSVLWKEPRAGEGSSHQAKQPPSFYYEDLIRPDAQALEKLRATRERLESYGFQPPKSHLHDSCASAGAGQRSGRHNSANYNESAFGRYNQQRKRIPVGPEFQAEIPRWVPPEERLKAAAAAAEGRGGPSNSGGGGDGDGENHKNRWLGVRVWPPAGAAVENSSLRPVGRGRPSSCDCPEPGSIQCVRVHIAAARARLRSELGPAFVDLGLDQMGECVADQYWTREEERTFRLVARTHLASKGSNFWDYLPDALPHKTRMELNSYYFNVFVLRRRALQNRLRDAKIDSDDDETELPGENEESEYGSTDEDDEEEEEDDEDDEDDGISSDGAGDAGIEHVPGAFPLKVPNDAGIRNRKSLPDFNFSPPEEVAHSRAEIGELEDEEEDEDEAEEGNRIAPDDSHVVLVWDDKPLEADSLVRGGGDGRHWVEHPNWDGRDHQGEVNSALAAGETLPTRQLSPPKEDVRQAPALGDLWSQNMEMAPTREKDKLLSTNGMILELFGDDDSECAGTVDSD